MTTPKLRFGRWASASVVLFVLRPALGQVAGQTDVSGVSGNTYTSPTFEYTVAWDD